MRKIQLKEVLKQISQFDHEGKPVYFNMKVRSFNTQNGRGGKLITYKNVRLCIPNNKKNTIRELKNTKVTKNPNHWAHRTRNVKLMNNEIKKVHTLFIVEFNGLKVYY